MSLNKLSFTVTSSEVTVYSGNWGNVVNNTAQDRECFVSNISVWDDYSQVTRGLYRSSRIRLQTDASGVKNLQITLNGWTYRNGTTTGNWTGPVQWAVSTSSSPPSSGWNNIAVTINDRGNISSSSVQVNMLPSTTYYLFIQHGGNFHWGYGSNGLVLTPTGVYGEPGDITVSSGYFGSAIPISFASATSGATYTVTTTTTVESGGNNGTTQYVETLQTNSSTSSLNWTPVAATYAAMLLNSGSTTSTISVSTYFGGALAGTRQKTITLSFDPATASPTLASGAFACSYLNTNTAIQGLDGYIQKYSLVHVAYDSSKVTRWENATVKEWRVRFGATATEITKASTDASQDSTAIQEDMTVTCTLVDSRGLTATFTENITVLPYVPPAITDDTEYYRCAELSDSESETGNRLAIKPVVTYSPLTWNGAAQNSLRFVFKWKYVSANAWTTMCDQTVSPAVSHMNPTMANNTKSWNYPVADYPFEDRSYNLWLTVTDALGNTSEWTRMVPSSKHFLTSTTGWDGAAFGRVAEYADTLDIGSWELICGNITMNGEDLGTLLAQIKAALNIQ